MKSGAESRSPGRRRKRPVKTIFKKVLTAYIGLVLLVGSLVSIVSFFLVRQYVMRTNMDELLSKAEMVAEMVARPGGRVRVLTIERLEELENLSGAHLIYVDAQMVARQLPVRYKDGRKATSMLERRDETYIEQIQIIGALDQELIKSLLAGNTATDVRKLEFMEDQILFAGAPIMGTDGTSAGALILYRPLVDVTNVTYRITVMLLLAILIAILIAILLAGLLSRRITQPLSALNQSAKHMADGYYGDRVQIMENDEIGQLGLTLNLLSSRLLDVIQTLSDEKIKLEQILASIGEGIVAVDQNGLVVHHNAAALALLELGAWQLREHAEPPPHQEQLMNMLHAVLSTGERAETAWKSASERSIAAIVSPVRNREGEVIGAVGLLRDVSETERLEQLRRDYVANVSHELRTPLTGIRGMVEPLMDGFIETPEERADCYRVIYQETLRLEKLIGEMLDMSRLQDGRIQLELEPVEVVSLLESAIRRMRERANEGQVALNIQADGQRPVAMGNENRILQVLIILMDNAISFTPPGGQVTLLTRTESERVWIGVRDTGSGIDPVDLPYIWERFYKADKSRMRTSGTGLGLAIAKLVVELMGGKIQVETQLGEGSTFEFFLAMAVRPTEDG